MADRGPAAGGASRTTLALLAKAPVAGFAKTRLIPRLGASGAAALHAALVDRAVTAGLAAGFGAVALWCAPARTAPFFARLGRRAGLDLHDQAGGDLGERMRAAFERHLPAGPVLLTGTDSPALGPALLGAAREALEAGEAAVLVPALDGGYAALGLSRGHPRLGRLFDGLPWGSGEVLAGTRARLGELGWRWRELAPVRDVDRPEDVDWLLGSGLLG